MASEIQKINSENGQQVQENKQAVKRILTR